MHWTARLAILPGIFTVLKACSHPSDDLFNIHITNFRTDFMFERHENFQNSTLYIVYKWTISKLPRANFDGFLYKLIDKDGSKVRKEGDSYDGFYKSEYDPEACVGLDSKIYALDVNLKPQLCSIPCKEHLPNVCNYSKVCTLSKMDYLPLDPTARELKFPIKFGRVYDLNLMFYKNWFTGRSAILDGGQIVAYCKHELVFNQNVTREDADKFCQNKMAYADSAKSSGPATHFEKLNITYNLTTNRAAITFRWKAPYDQAPDMWLAGFFVYVKTNSSPSAAYKVKTSNETEKTGFYKIAVDNVELNRRNWLLIVPKLDYTGTCARSPCIDYGISLREYYSISDIDACREDNGTGRYCSDDATCIDMPGKSNISAKCSCHEGFSGNGISTVWSEGTGCYANEQTCMPNDSSGICDPVADCVKATCTCPFGYMGDGLKLGTGCSHRNLVIGIGVCAPLVAILLVAFGYYVWRNKKYSNRGVRLQEEDL